MMIGESEYPNTMKLELEKHFKTDHRNDVYRVFISIILSV